MDLLDLDLHARVQPVLLHQVFVLGRQVDRIDHPALAIEQATGAGEEHDLVGLQLFDQVIGRPVGVQVDHLPAGSFAEAGNDRDRTGLDRCLDALGVDGGDLADQAVLALVEEVGLEHAAGDRSRAHAGPLQGFDQAQVLAHEHATDDAQHLGRGHPQTVDGLLGDAGGLHLFVELRAGAMQHDRRQADLLQEGQRTDQRLHLVAQDRAADLDQGEALGVDLRETFQVLLDLLSRGHVGEQADDSGAEFFGHGAWMGSAGWQ